MDNRSDWGGVIIALGLVLILFLLIAGAGLYLFIGRSQLVAVRRADEARMAEIQARMQAELNLLQAQAVTTSVEKESSTVESETIRAAVESVLRTQEEAWNRGDVDAFMEHYWKSGDLTFSSGGKTTRGWDETLNHYRERYPTPEKMGHLKLSGLEITPLGDSAAMVLGQWNVERESEPLSGNFSLVVRKIDDRWLIVHDHTSRITE